MKRCSTLLIIQEMQIKTTMRYYLIPVRMAIVKKATNDKPWRVGGEKGNLLHYCLVQPLWKRVWQFLGVSLVAQLVKNPPALQETLVRFLGREDPLEKG